LWWVGLEAEALEVLRLIVRQTDRCENVDDCPSICNRNCNHYHLTAVLNALEEEGGPLKPKDIANRTNIALKTIEQQLIRAVDAGEIVKPKRGLYALPSYIAA
jgi:hypothetical protein